jgi:hypothetical protein
MNFLVKSLSAARPKLAWIVEVLTSSHGGSLNLMDFAQSIYCARSARAAPSLRPSALPMTETARAMGARVLFSLSGYLINIAGRPGLRRFTVVTAWDIECAY